MAAKKKTKRIPRTQRVDEMTDLILDIFWSTDNASLSDLWNAAGQAIFSLGWRNAAEDKR